MITGKIERRETTWRSGRLSWYEAGEGPPLILLHGGGGTGKAWWYQLDHFADRYRVIAPDMPGFGQSDWGAGIAATADLGPALWEWLDVWQVPAAVLGGNSMGGRVALAAALVRPDRVRALLLLDAVGVDIPNIPVVNPLTLPAHAFVSGLVHDPARYRRLTPYRSLQDAHELNRGRESYARYLDQGPLMAAPDAPLETLAAPSLLIWGRYDRIVPLAYGEALRDRLADAELVVLEECGHLPHLELPTETNAAIDQFLFRRLGFPPPAG